MTYSAEFWLTRPLAEGLPADLPDLLLFLLRTDTEDLPDMGFGDVVTDIGIRLDSDQSGRFVLITGRALSLPELDSMSDWIENQQKWALRYILAGRGMDCRFGTLSDTSRFLPETLPGPASYQADFLLDGPIRSRKRAQDYFDEMERLLLESAQDTLPAVDRVSYTLRDEARGYISICTRHPLSDMELDTLKEWLAWQNASGIGSDFQYQEFACWVKDGYTARTGLGAPMNFRKLEE